VVTHVQKELEKAHIRGLVDGAEGNTRLVARMKELGKELNYILDQPLPEFDYDKANSAGKFKQVLWELWALINGKVESLLTEKTDWAKVHNATFTFQQGLLRDLRDKMGYGTAEIAIDNLVANPEFKERTRKSYGSAMSSFYAMVGVKDPQ
jgi:hypothetical protein